VFDLDTARAAAANPNNRNPVRGVPKSVIPDPLNRQPEKRGSDGRKLVDATNYFLNTIATFEKVADPGPQADAMWASLKARGRLDHVSDYGSQYVIIGDTLYRYADHWGRFASVTWDISPRPKQPPPSHITGGYFDSIKRGYAIGKVQFMAMKIK
jgi:hypothetical protein